MRRRWRSREHPEHGHPEEGGDRQRELSASHRPQPPHPRQVGERQGRGHDHGRKRGLREVAEEPRYDDEHEHDDPRSDQAGDLCLGAGLLGHRGARPAGADRKALEESRGHVRRADADHFLVGLHLVATPGGERRRRRDGVRQRDQGDSKRPATSSRDPTPTHSGW